MPRALSVTPQHVLIRPHRVHMASLLQIVGRLRQVGMHHIENYAWETRRPWRFFQQARIGALRENAASGGRYTAGSSAVPPQPNQGQPMFTADMQAQPGSAAPALNWHGPSMPRICAVASGAVAIWHAAVFSRRECPIATYVPM